MSANPHYAESYQGLGEACSRLAVELRRRKKRTPEERADLARQAADLLSEVARRLTPNIASPCEPEYYIDERPDRIVPQFMEHAETEQRNARLRVLNKAAGLVLGKDAWSWQHQADPAIGMHPHMAATRDSAGLRMALELLQAKAIADGLAGK